MIHRQTVSESVTYRMENVPITGKPHLKYCATLTHNVLRLRKYKLSGHVGNKNCFLLVLTVPCLISDHKTTGKAVQDYTQQVKQTLFSPARKVFYNPCFLNLCLVRLKYKYCFTHEHFDRCSAEVKV